MNCAIDPLPVLEQTALAWRAIQHLQRRGVVVLHAECGWCQKPVIHVAHNRAAGELKDAESHVVRHQDGQTFHVMVTDYRGCQIQWTEQRGARHDG